MSPMAPEPHVAGSRRGWREDGAGAERCAALAGVLEREVHDSGDGVGSRNWAAAPSRRTAGLPDGDRGNDGDVRALRAVGDAVAEPGDEAARWRRLPWTRMRAWSSRPSTSASSPSATPAAIVRTGNRRPHHGSAVRDLATCAAALKPGSEDVTS